MRLPGRRRDLSVGEVLTALVRHPDQRGGLMVLEALGAVVVLATMWAALKFEGTPGVEGGASSDEGGVLVSDAASVARIPETRIPDAPAWR